MSKKSKVVNLHNYELPGVVLKLNGKEYEFIKQWTENSKEFIACKIISYCKEFCKNKSAK